MPIHPPLGVLSNWSQEMGFSSLPSSASHQVLATSFSWILATSTWFSPRILAAFRRSVMSINRCSAPRGFSVPEKFYMLQPSEIWHSTWPLLLGCSHQSLSQELCQLLLASHHPLEYPHHVFSLYGPSRDVLGPLRVPRLSIFELTEKVMKIWDFRS